MGAWTIWIWGHWYTALRAEAAVLADHPDAAAASPPPAPTSPNPVATALVDRAHAFLHRDHRHLRALTTTFTELGSPYQAARTTTLAERR